MHDDVRVYPRSTTESTGRRRSLLLAKGIISGDLDCDKVDYVARDAYYAGIPTATDIDRLLSQLVAVKARDDISAPDLHYSFGRGNPSGQNLT